MYNIDWLIHIKKNVAKKIVYSSMHIFFIILIK